MGNTILNMTRFSQNKKQNELIKMFDIDFVNYNSLKPVEFDEIIKPSKYGFDGRSSKKFKRVNASGFRQMIEEIKNNPNCSYITYINKVVKEGIVPEKLAVMDKLSDLNSVKNEAIATRLLNYFEVPTSFNLPVQSKDEYHSLSVDFISENEEFIELYTLLPPTEGEYFIEKTYRIIEIVEYYLKKLYKDEQPEKFKDNLEKFKRDLVVSFFVRQFVLGDIDCNMVNSGLLINTETWDFKLINFDLEWSLNKWRNSENFNFEYAMRKYKNEVDEVYNKCITLANALDKQCSESSQISIAMLSIRDNITKLFNLIKDYENAKNKDLPTN